MPRVSGARASLTITHTWALPDWVRALSWSADSAQVAAACADGSVLVTPAADRAGMNDDAELVHEHPGGALAVAYSCAGVLASSGEDGRLLLDGQVCDDGSGWVEHLAWRRDGGLLAATRRRYVSFYSPAGKRTATSPAMPATVACIDWHPRGRLLAAGCYGGVRLLHGGDARHADRLEWTGSVLTLAFNPDGTRLAHGNQDASVHFWELRRKRELEMTGYPLKVRQLAWSNDGRWLATGGGDVITLWDFAGRGPAGTRPRELERHDDRLAALAFQPRGRLLASAAHDGLVCLWDVEHDDLPLATVALQAPAHCLQWSPDGQRLAIGASDGTLAILRAATE